VTISDEGLELLHALNPKLSVELVPKTCWYSNVRTNTTRAEWEKCKKYAKTKSNSKCEICGSVGSRWAVECHEIWHYDDATGVQKLLDLIALCPRCHEVKHYGYAELNNAGERAFLHLTEVNGWTPAVTALYLTLVNLQWEKRSTRPWVLDISVLAEIMNNNSTGDPVAECDPAGSTLTARRERAMGQNDLRLKYIKELEEFMQLENVDKDGDTDNDVSR
jgi:hypothetical protein